MWVGSFVITNITLYGVVEIKSLETTKIFKVNEHHLKSYYEDFSTRNVEEITLNPPEIQQ